jgi:xylose isomerase
VWDFARGCMRNYMILAEKAEAYRNDPEVIAAQAYSQLPELAIPTMTGGESMSDFRAETFDADARGARGAGFDRLDQLAVEHLFGVR